jgi:hypothetical protein
MNNTILPMGTATIYTVSTGNYKYGAFALINSVRNLGLNNPIVIGTDMHLPELENIEGITQIVLNSDWNGLNLKSVLILEHPAEHFIFFDADIILTHPDFIPELERLLSLNKFIACIDGIVSQHEYRRLYWSEIYPHGNKPIEHCWYYNSGFFAGVFSLHQHVLSDWRALTKKHLDPKAYLFAHPKLPMADQDTFNAILQTLPLDSMATIQMPDWRAISIQEHPFYHIGNFIPHAFLHCTGKNKPWAINSTPANAPNTYDDLWYQYLFIKTRPVKSDFNLSFLQKQWFQRTVISRLIIKLKKIFA